MFTLAAALGGAVVAGFFSERARKAERRAATEQRSADARERAQERLALDLARWRDIGADVLGRTREFLTDVHPHRVTMNFQPGSAQEVIQSLNARGESLREPLSQLAVGHPSPQARKLADEVVSGLHRTLHWVGWAVNDLAAHRPFTEAVENGMAEWTALDLKMNELREALHDVSLD